MRGKEIRKAADAIVDFTSKCPVCEPILNFLVPFQAVSGTSLVFHLLITLPPIITPFPISVPSPLAAAA